MAAACSALTGKQYVARSGKEFAGAGSGNRHVATPEAMLYRNFPDRDRAHVNRILRREDQFAGDFAPLWRIGNGPERNVRVEQQAHRSGFPEQLGDLVVVPVDIVRNLEFTDGDADATPGLRSGDGHQPSHRLAVSGDYDLVSGPTGDLFDQLREMSLGVEEADGEHDGVCYTILV